MAIVIHGPEEIERARRAGQVAAHTLATVLARLRPGVTTAQIDRWVRSDTAARGARPSQLGYHGFPAAVCTSEPQPRRLSRHAVGGRAARRGRHHQRRRHQRARRLSR